MINDGINNVPENTIAVIYDDFLPGVNFERISNSVYKPGKKREWFDNHFYNCLPLIIGNQYGFVITAEYGFNAIWNGGNNQNDISITYIIPENLKNKRPILDACSHFGFGIITVATTFVLRTPIGINLMTINPPNHIIKNATVMTGVIESDNIRAPFTFNIRIHEPNVLTSFPAGTPLSGFIPIPRMFADQFELKDAEKVFGEEVFNEELEMFINHEAHRGLKNYGPEEIRGMDRDYFHGQDLLGNKFLEHQNANGKIKKSTTFPRDI